jgi:hypothetical protein
MILLNFGKKFDEINLSSFHQISGKKITEQIMLPIESDNVGDFLTKLEKLFVKVNLTEEEFASEEFVVNPSRESAKMCVLLAYMIKKTGRMPFLVQSRVAFGMSSRPEIMDVLDLQKIAEKENPA